MCAEDKEEKDLSGELQAIRDKTERLQDDLEEEEAIDILEEAVGDVERLGERLEEGDA